MAYLLFRKPITLLLLALGLWACQDHRVNPPTAQRYRLKQQILTYPGGQVFVTFNYEYDQLNRLSLRTRNFPVPNSSLKSGPSDTIQADRDIYTYDTQNRLVRRDHHIDYHLSCCIAPTTFGTRTNITYDDPGRRATIEASEAYSDFGNFKPSSFKTQYEFGPNNEVVKGTSISLIDSSVIGSSVYRYANGNLVEEQSSGPNTVSRSITKYEYDDAPSPFGEPSLNAARLVTGSFSRNNETKRTITDQTTLSDGTIQTRTQTTVTTTSYNDKGLLAISASTTLPVDRFVTPFVVNTSLFIYETY